MYSKDLRLVVIKYIDKGHTIKKACETFGIAKQTIINWRNKLKREGNLDPKTRVGKCRKLDEEGLLKRIEEQPDLYIWELAQEFGVGKTTIFDALKRNKITRKKRVFDIRKVTKRQGRNTLIK